VREQFGLPDSAASVHDKELRRRAHEALTKERKLVRPVKKVHRIILDRMILWRIIFCRLIR
jgi:hypothetical protein